MAASIRRRRSTSPTSSSAPASAGAPTWRTWASRSRSRRGRPPRPTHRRPASARTRCGRSDQDVRKADPSTGYAGSGYAARHNPFAYFHSLLDLGSCTRRTFRSTVSMARWRAGRRTSPSSRRTSATRASPPSATRTSRIRARPRPTSSSRSGSRRSWPPRLPAGRRPDHHLRRGDPRRQRSARRDPAALEVPDPGSTNAGAFNPYSIFRTVEDLFGLQHLAAATRTGTTSFASDLLGSQKKKKKRRSDQMKLGKGS